MAEYDGYVRIKTEISDGEATKKLASLANNLNRQLSALEKQRGKVAELEQGYNKLAKAGREYYEAAKSGAGETTLDNMVSNIEATMKELGFSKDQFAEFERASRTGNVANTSAMVTLRENIESARTAQNGLAANVENTRAAFEAERAAANDVVPSIEKSQSAIERFTERIGKMAKTALIFYSFRRAFTMLRQSISSMSGLSAVTGVFTDFNEKMKEAYSRNTELQASLASLRGSLYTAFTPISQAIVPMLVNLANWLARVVGYIGAFFAALNGKKISDNAAAAQDLAKSVGGVGSAAKEANKQLASFDKLNNLSGNTGAGGGGGASAPVAFNTDLDEGKTNKLIELAQKAREALSELGAAFKLEFQGISDFLGGIFTGDIDRAFTGISEIIQSWVMAWELAANMLFDFLTGFWGSLHKWVEDAINSLFDWLEQKTGYSFETIRTTLTQWWDAVYVSIQGAIDGLRTAFHGITEFISGVFTGDWKRAWNGIVDVFRGIANAIISVFEGALNSVIAVINTVLGFVSNLANIVGFDGVNLRISNITIPKFADGGFPSIGSMFIAGEAGPELVGSFGSHNNSVINEAQLVQAFQSATAEQVTLLRQQNALLQGILEKSGVVSFSPSAAAGKVFSQSIGMYNRAMG